MHDLVLAEVCVVLAGSIEREAGSFGLWAESWEPLAHAAVPGLKQLTNSRRSSSLRPPFPFAVLFLLLAFTFPAFVLFHLQISFFFLSTFFLFFLSSRGSLWQSRRRKVGQWVSSGNRLRQPVCWMQLESCYSQRAAQALLLKLLIIISLHVWNTIDFILFMFASD